MVHAPDPRSIIEAAEQAAATGDYRLAGQLLGQAAAVQEAQLGPLHPDLANTFNNLGVVFERAGNLDDAERSYRRAYTIASTARGPDDPLTVTSRENLSEFCAARGLPFDATPAPPTQAPPTLPAAPASKTAVPVRERTATARATRVPAIVIGSVLVGVVALAVSLLREPRPADTAPAIREEVARPAADSAPPPPAPPIEPAKPAARASTPAPTRETRTRRAATTVVDARLCRSLSTVTWECTRAADPSPPGPFYYYTRLRADADTTVQHRWYWNKALISSTNLRIARNQGPGFRTYSRFTIIDARKGNWRVELRAADGSLLREQTFTVR